MIDDAGGAGGDGAESGEEAAGTAFSRRTFIRTTATATGGLVLGVGTTGCRAVGESATQTVLEPSAFLRLEPDGSATVTISKSEMGQGVTTAFALLVAEELDAAWESIRVEQAELDTAAYGEQATGGSSSVRLMWEPLRRAGAAARALLVSTAAEEWGVPDAECSTAAGFVRHDSTGRSVPYSDLIAAAARRPIPDAPALKRPDEFRLIGRRHPPVLSPGLTSGAVRFGLDVRLPDLVFAAVLRPPVEGAELESFDAGRARRMDGIRRIVEVPAVGKPFHVRGGIAVIAEDTWSALRAREEVEARWGGPPGPAENTERLRRALHRRVTEPGFVVSERGNVEEALSVQGTRVQATYETPFLAHATMEPMNCTARVDADRCELWTPAQFPGWAAEGVARALGIPAENVTVHVTRLGGGFGRRINPDFSVEAALVARAADAPVQVVWSREDDLRHGFYRPMVVHRIEAVLDAEGRPHGLRHRIAGTPLTPMYGDPEGAERFVGETGGAAHTPYRCPHFRCEASGVETPIKRGWWRSVPHSHSAFGVECFMNELAAAAGRDPLQYRLDLIDGSAPMPLSPLEAQGEEYEFDPKRLEGVLRTVAEESGWGTPLPAGRGRGVACRWSMATYVAEVVEVEVTAENDLVIHRVTAAVDCGIVVNRDGAEAQVEGGIVDALSAALGQEITVTDGRVDQENFDSYPLLRIDEAPRSIDVHFVSSTRPPSGLGEPAVPPAAPALVAAIHDATGRRIRRLPVDSGLLKRS